MHEYHDAQDPRRLPPPFTSGNEGRKLLSWRVLILPYLGHTELFLKFRLDEPWDSKHNRSLLPFMPEVFAPPEEALIAQEPNTTFCQVFVGPGTAFESAEGLKFSALQDGSSSTVLIIEASKAVPWTKPEDIEYSPDQPLPAFGSGAKSSSFFFRYTSSFCLAMADGSAQSIWIQSLRDESLRAAITRNDGTKVDSLYWP